MNKNLNFWTCVVGPANFDTLPGGADLPLRRAVQTAFENLTGNQPEICSSGWGNKSLQDANSNIEKNIVYAVRTHDSKNPELRELTSGELLSLITNFAKDYSKESVQSIVANRHMNEVSDEDEVDKKVVDATLVDFVNYIASKYGIDYALYTDNLNDKKRNLKFEI